MRPTLIPHAQSAAPPVEISVDVRRDGRTLGLHYHLAGDLDAIAIPHKVLPDRTDNLWKNSCFETFIRIGSEQNYLEFNLSPSTRWAAYAFDDYRAAMRDADVEQPAITVTLGAALTLCATIVLPAAFAPAHIHLGLSAIIEGNDGSKGWYALAHPPGPPDFHHPDCFALEVTPRI